jgi:ABC-type Zn uptake system ZnuABC Zn-binding protein ZnuA
MRIIDKDCEFYAAEVEEMARQLRQCRPASEDYFKARRDAAAKVSEALEEYRRIIQQVGARP